MQRRTRTDDRLLLILFQLPFQDVAYGMRVESDRGSTDPLLVRFLANPARYTLVCSLSARQYPDVRISIPINKKGYKRVFRSAL
jgi:hypothetical protein